MQTMLEIGFANAVMAFALALVAAGIGLFSPRPAIRHTVWLLVLLKLVTPPVFSIPISCPAVFEEEVRPPPTEVVQDQDEESLALLNAEPFSAATDLGYGPSSDQHRIGGPVASSLSRLTLASFVPIVFVVWLSGVIVWFAVAGARIYRFSRLLRYGRAAPRPLQDEACLLAERLGLACCPTVWLVPGRVSPLLWALGQITYLVVPADLLDSLRPEQRSSLLAHELAHARRRDHWVRWLEFVVTGLYWWLPVAWWARQQLQQAEEECCDAWVVWTLPAMAKAYAKALLQTVDFLDARPALPPVASGIGHVHSLKRRLTMIARQPSYPCPPWPVQLAVVALGLLFLPLAPQRLAAQAAKEEPAPVLSDDDAVARAEQDPDSRNTERRLRILEEKMDRLMQKLDAQRGEKPSGKPGVERGAKEKEKPADKAKLADEKARTKDREKKEIMDLKRRFAEDVMSPEQMDRLKEEIHAKLQQAQKRIQEEVGKNLSPERMEEIQRRVDEALKRATQQLNDAMKRSTEQMERAKSSLAQAKKGTPPEPRVEKPRRGQDQRDLERRMDRLEQKMDKVLEALEKQGKSSKL
jgi:bla regulator protein BlaR1